MDRPAPSEAVDKFSEQARQGEFQQPANHYYYFIRSRLAAAAGQMEQAARLMEEAVKKAPREPVLKKELALIYLKQDRKEKALALAEDVLAQNPENVEALIIAGSIRQATGRNDAARKTYEKVVEKAPDRENIYPVLARLYLQDKEYEKTVKLLEPFVKRFPQNYTGFYYLGKAYSGLGEPDSAVDAYNKCLEIDPGLVQPRAALIEIYKGRGKDKKAIAQYEKLLARHPKNVPAAIELGLLYEKIEKTERAAELWSELSARVSSDPEVIKSVIRKLLGQQRYDDAVTVLSAMLRSAPKNPEVLYLAGAARYMMEQFDKALEYFSRVRPGDELYTDAMIHRAIIYNKQGKPEKAVSVMETAMENVGSQARVTLIPYLSAFYQEQGLYEQAADLLEKGISMEPENIELHYELGVLYDKTGKKDAAIEKMKQVIKMDPQNADALNYLGYTYADSGIKLDKAESLIRRALDLEPDSGYILDSMGWVYYRKGDYERARKYLEKALKQVSDDPVILEHMADVYLKLNLRHKALEYYRRALENAGKDKESLADKIETLQKEGLQP